MTYLELYKDAERKLEKNEITIGEYEEMIAPLKIEIPEREKGEIEKKCDRINSIASVLSYPQHREIQELLCEIIASIGKAESEE